MHTVSETVLIVRGYLLKMESLEKESVLMDHVGGGLSDLIDRHFNKSQSM